MYHWRLERCPKVLSKRASFIRFKRRPGLATSMQMFNDLFFLMIILQALFIQSIWLALGRIARNRYLEDIMHFRSPSSLLSRYYGWRTDSFVNAIAEGVMLEFVLVASLIGFSLLLASLEALFAQGFLVLFVVVLTFLSSVQLAWRIREITSAENRITDSIGPTRDKIGFASDIVDNLYSQGEMGDGRVWFALFRMSQRQDPVGWAIRDVLLEKSKEEQERMLKRSAAQPDSEDPTTGPGIA